MTSLGVASGPTAREMRKRAGAWLQQLRDDAGLTQADLGALLGHGYTSTVSQVERGLSRVPPQRWLSWAAALRQPPRDFAKRLLYWYDPHAHASLFGGENPQVAEGLAWEPSNLKRNSTRVRRAHAASGVEPSSQE